VGDLLRPSLLEFIQKRVPGFDPKSFICLDDLGQFRRDYVKEVLEDEIGELSVLDQEVIDSLQAHEILSENIGRNSSRSSPSASASPTKSRRLAGAGLLSSSSSPCS